MTFQLSRQDGRKLYQSNQMIEQNFVVGNVGIKLLDLRDVRVQDSNVSLEIGFTWWTGVTTPPPSPCKDQIVWLVCGREELKNDRERVSAFWGASLLAIPLRADNIGALMAILPENCRQIGQSITEVVLRADIFEKIETVLKREGLDCTIGDVNLDSAELIVTETIQGIDGPVKSRVVVLVRQDTTFHELLG